MEAKLYRHDPIPDGQRASTFVLGAAVAVIIVSAVGIGAATGVIPRALSDGASEGASAGASSPMARLEPATSSCTSCGTVASIRAVELRTPAGEEPDARAARGTTATILSAAGGIFASQEFQHSLRKRYSYRVTLRMDDGSYRTVSESAPPRFAVGQKVRLVDGTLAAVS
jgi:outer membrane lipoprotein SlyB